MSYTHSNCVPKAQYWSMYNKLKDDGYYIESRELQVEKKLLKDTIIDLESRDVESKELQVELQVENKLLKDTIRDLESKLNLQPTKVATYDKPDKVIFSRGSQINNR